MVFELKLRKIGNPVGMILPKEALAHLKAKCGDVICLTESTGGSFRLFANDPEFARGMKIAESISRRYSNALKELAK